MSDTIIEVDRVSKRYELGKIGTGSLRRDLHYWWNSAVLKKEDPYFINGKNNGEDFIWALKDINFELKQGEALGIIGSNGSGKSTLLKIISRIINPTKGAVRGRGKISSLLEVGTGFNPELTGRQNIFLSGYILGMNKKEILSKFDEMVAFSGIEKFIDTPVKRYSSGMYMRLAFSVAAHLEPDILIVDEVLAVGDADFQKKCMGKMQDVSSNNGRTILFVSHNLPAITNLCSTVLWLEKGNAMQIGKPVDVVESYLNSLIPENIGKTWALPDDAPGNDEIKIKSAKVKSQTGEKYVTVETPIQLDFEFWCFLENCSVNVNVILSTDVGECVFNLGSPNLEAKKGVLGLTCVIPGNLLNNKNYSISLKFIKNNASTIYEFPKCITFEVEDVRNGMHYFGEWPGVIRPFIKSQLYMKEQIN